MPSAISKIFINTDGQAELQADLQTELPNIHDLPCDDYLDIDDEEAIQEPLLIKYTPPQAEEPPELDDENLSIAQRLKIKAQLKLSESKGNFDEYFGRSLPERSFDLEFTLPLQKPRKEFDHIISSFDLKKLQEAKKAHHSIFKYTETEMAKLAKCQLSSGNRQQILDSFWPYMVEKLAEVIQNLDSKPNLASDTKRLELSTYCLGTLKQVIVGYRQLVANLYTASNVVYGPQRGTFYTLCQRLFESLTLEQQLCRSLHLPLPTGSIKTCNKLFAAIKHYEPNLVSEPFESLLTGDKTSIKALYFQYQIYLALDLTQLAPPLN